MKITTDNILTIMLTGEEISYFKQLIGAITDRGNSTSKTDFDIDSSTFDLAYTLEDQLE